jgi:hypothetical protein
MQRTSDDKLKRREELKKASIELGKRQAEAFVAGLNASVRLENQSQTEEKSLQPQKA